MAEPNPQICYVLTGDGNCIYTQMTCISAALTRRLYPACKIIVLVDEVTDASLTRTNSSIELIADRLICVQTGRRPAGTRNRFVKTKMRQMIEGDFVYLDADAIPIRRFDEMYQCSAPMAASLDLDDMTWQPSQPQRDIELLKGCGWRSHLPRYFNAGVLFFADCPDARKVSEEWHTRWEGISSKSGVHRDQPAFNSAIDAVGLSVHVLPKEFNAAVYLSPWFARNARILHCWTNAGNGRPPANTLLAHLLNVWNQTGQIDWEAVERARKRPLSFNGWREILVALLGPRGRIPRKWLWNLRKSLNARRGSYSG